MNSKPPVNLTETNRDYAIYLPAISSFYANQLAKGDSCTAARLPVTFDRGAEGLNFLNEKEGYYTYKYGLYSAGHAEWDLQKCMTKEAMVQQRDRSKTVILGDSGGFQIGRGVIKFDWHNFQGPDANNIRTQILNWLEHTADWSMFLDVPTWACDSINRKKTGLTSFNDCLDKTKINNDFFMKNRQGKTKFLNVLQGTTWEETETWYHSVKEYSDPKIWGDKAAEGWAMGSATMCRMDITLKRLMTMREDGMLLGKNWMHFLGTAQLDWSCFLTLIQRQIRKHINPNLNISFDCASPFLAAANGMCYTKVHHTNKRWSIAMEKAPDNKALAGSNIPFPFESELGRRMVMGDVCHYAPGMLNKLGKEGKTSWDMCSYVLYMGHNVFVHIDAVQKANQLMDIEMARVGSKIDWRKWRKLKSSDFSDEYSVWVPRNILYFARFVEELFETKTLDEAFAMIEEGKAFLYSLEGTRLRNGIARNHFTTLFDEVHEDVVMDKSVSSVFAMPELDDTALDKLSEMDDAKS